MVTLKGEPISLDGKLIEEGQTAPDFELVNSKLERVSLSAFEGKLKILNIFPSVDTGVCALSLKKFQEKVLQFKEKDLVVLHISKDLPFAQSRFCLNEGQKDVQTLSAFDSSFGKDYGLLIETGPLKGLLSRCVIILDAHNKIQYVELVSDITQEPNYGQAFESLENYLNHETN